MLAVRPAGDTPVSGTPSRARRYVPTRYCGTYRLPPRVIDMLAARLRAFRNAATANRLAAFIARFHAGPETFGRPIYLDRRRLKGHPELDMTEDEVRGAIRTLEKVGFIERLPQAGTGYVQKGGKCQRAPLTWTFGADFKARFAHLAGRKASSPRCRGFQDSRIQGSLTPYRRAPSRKKLPNERYIMGEKPLAPPPPRLSCPHAPPEIVADPGLEAALARFMAAGAERNRCGR